MRTRRAFKRTIGILAVLLILSAALNIALIIMLSKANGGANAAEPTPIPMARFPSARALALRG